MLDLGVLKSLLEKATPGEWSLSEPWAGYCSINAERTPIIYTTTAGCDNAEANHNTIVAIHNAAPALIAELRELRAEVARVIERFKDAEGEQTLMEVVEAVFLNGEAGWKLAHELQDDETMQVEVIGDLMAETTTLKAEIEKLREATHWRPIADPLEGA